MTVHTGSLLGTKTYPIENSQEREDDHHTLWYFCVEVKFSGVRGGWKLFLASDDEHPDVEGDGRLGIYQVL